MIKKDPQNQLNKYVLTEVDITQAKLLSPEQAAYYEHVATEIAETLLTTKFSHEPTEREGQVMQFVYLQAKRETYLEILEDSVNTYQRLASNET